MNPDDARDREIQALRDRLSRLSEASLSINESLEFHTVLKVVVDSARVLTGADFGVITALHEAVELPPELPPDWDLTSNTMHGCVPLVAFVGSGVTDEQIHRMRDWPERLLLFDYLRQLPGPLRTPDLSSHTMSLGMTEFSALPVGPFLTAPLRHQGEGVGNIFLGRERGMGEFTAEDEETLVMFASQAAMAIANARRYRDEQRAKADLETLINTSPVGVAVFDARTGAPVSFNREAVRIMEALRTPDNPPEQLLEVLTVQRADGRKVSLREFPFAETLRSGETLRAEEITLSVPDGRSVTILVNATPIRSDDGEVTSVVTTMQDITALEELERLRAEFLAMVSHELRTPLTSVKGSITTLLDPPSPLNPAEMRQFFRIIDSQVDRMHVLISDLLDVARIETGTLAVSPEPTDVALLAGEACNGFRSGGGRHDIDLDLARDLPWVMADRLRMVQVLGNLLTNAAKHSPESSTISVSAVGEGVHVMVSVSDRGRGIPAESLPHLFRKFSRLESQEQGGDTGLGLAICKGIVEAHGGRIWAESDGPGLGARFTFTLPTVEAAGYVSPAGRSQPSTRSSRRRGAEQVPILAVDDDPQALRYVRDALVRSGYEPLLTADPEEALRIVAEERPRLVLLDLVLPGTDGIDLMKAIAETTDAPVIFLSAYGQDKLVARAFDNGAADYVVKPFSPTELSARIRAALRRREAPKPSEPFVLGDLTIDYDERRVTLAGRPVELTAIEYRTLAELSANAGRVLTYEHLLRRVWGLESGADVRPMRTVISSIRRKLGDDSENPAYIFTEIRVGYRMAKGEAQVDGKEISDIGGLHA